MRSVIKQLSVLILVFMYWGRLVKIDRVLYPISTQRNLAVASKNISMLLNPVNYGPLDGSATQEALSPPWSLQRTSGTQSGRWGHLTLPSSTNDGEDINANYNPYQVGACKQSGSSFAYVIDFSSSDDITFSLPPTLHHRR